MPLKKEFKTRKKKVVKKNEDLVLTEKEAIEIAPELVEDEKLEVEEVRPSLKLTDVLQVCYANPNITVAGIAKELGRTQKAVQRLIEMFDFVPSQFKDFDKKCEISMMFQVEHILKTLIEDIDSSKPTSHYRDKVNMIAALNKELRLMRGESTDRIKLEVEFDWFDQIPQLERAKQIGAEIEGEIVHGEDPKQITKN